jgi:hypothetical protein
MIFELKTVLNFYKKLLSFYPSAFRERFGESMGQTFNDVCHEQKRLKGKVSLAFIFSTFAETSVGVIKENLAGANQMNYWLKIFGIAAIFSLLFTAAFFTLGTFFADNPDVQSGNFSFPILDFFRSWLILTLVFMPIVSGLHSGEQISVKDFFFPLAAAVIFGLLLIAPFALMEYWNNPRIQSGEFRFPFLLFLGLWLSPVLFFLGATPIARSLRGGESVLAHPVWLTLRVVFLAILAILWVNLIRDQMSCFLGGVPGCD